MTRTGRIAAVAVCFASLIAAGTWQFHRIHLARNADATRRLAEGGDAKAEAELGTTYYYGRGVPQSYEQAFLWAQKAANQRNSRAEYDLGYLYQFGRGVTQDDLQAFNWFQKSANQGEMRAQNALGNMYYYGRGVQEDRSIAAVWYRKAAEQGLPGAQYALGYAYGRGQGVPQNHVEADRWFHKAAAQAYQPAQQALGLRGYGLRGWSVAVLSAIFAWSLWNLKDPSWMLSAWRHNQAAIFTSCLGLTYVALRVYGAYGLFPSVLTVDICIAAVGLVLGGVMGMVLNVFSKRIAKSILGICGVLLVAMSLAFAKYPQLWQSIPSIHALCSLGGLLIGISIPCAVFLWRAHRRQATVQSATSA